jgi:hypothetical protein
MGSIYLPSVARDQRLAHVFPTTVVPHPLHTAVRLRFEPSDSLANLGSGVTLIPEQGHAGNMLGLVNHGAQVNTWTAAGRGSCEAGAEHTPNVLAGCGVRRSLPITHRSSGCCACANTLSVGVQPASRPLRVTTLVTTAPFMTRLGRA